MHTHTFIIITHTPSFRGVHALATCTHTQARAHFYTYHHLHQKQHHQHHFIVTTADIHLCAFGQNLHRHALNTPILRAFCTFTFFFFNFRSKEQFFFSTSEAKNKVMVSRLAVLWLVHLPWNRIQIVR